MYIAQGPELERNKITVLAHKILYANGKYSNNNITVEVLGGPKGSFISRKMALIALSCL